MDSEVDDYEPTDSEQEYNEEEREIMNDLRKEHKKRADKFKNQKRDVLSFSESDDDDDVAELMRDSDIEGADNDDEEQHDALDWGKDTRTYYNTDFVDPDYSSFTAQEEELAKAEEEEAMKMQLRLMKNFNEADFLLDNMEEVEEAIRQENEMGKGSETIKVSTDLSGLSQRDRIQLLQKDSPEFIGITEEFQRLIKEVRKLTAPVLNYVRNHQVPMVPALQFAQLYQNILLSHCSNVAFYLLLKAKRISIKYHPVTKRLVQLKQLREQLTPRYEEFIRPQLEALLERIRDGDAFTVLDMAQRKAKLQILNQYNEVSATKRGQSANDDDDDSNGDDDTDDEEQKAAAEEAGENGEEDEEENERRGITYQIAKNKGLTPHRKKELRNPRVKHRGKYRKALIRRKGAVRTVRKEVSRYGGEVSGIKATVTKSIKFKT